MNTKENETLEDALRRADLLSKDGDDEERAGFRTGISAWDRLPRNEVNSLRQYSPLSGFTILAGKPEAGKMCLALNWALQMERPVILLNCTESKRRMRERLHWMAGAIKNTYERPSTHRFKFVDPLKIMEFKEAYRKESKEKCQDAKSEWLALMGAVVEIVSKQSPCAPLVVVDSLQAWGRNFSDESLWVAMRNYAKACAELADRHKGVHVIGISQAEGLRDVEYEADSVVFLADNDKRGQDMEGRTLELQRSRVVWDSLKTASGIIHIPSGTFEWENPDGA